MLFSRLRGDIEKLREGGREDADAKRDSVSEQTREGGRELGNTHSLNQAEKREKEAEDVQAWIDRLRALEQEYRERVRDSESKLERVQQEQHTVEQNLKSSLVSLDQSR